MSKKWERERKKWEENLQNTFFVYFDSFDIFKK